MNKDTADELTARTNAFYQEVSASFSATRQAPWPGWARAMDLCGVDGAPSLDVLDVACGNLRFERFLLDRVGRLHVWAVDNCDELVGKASLPDGCYVAYQHLDVAHDPLGIVAPPCDLAVCFGFMHHLPTEGQRGDVLRSLVGHVRQGGLVVVSFWQLERDPRLVAKARPLAGAGANAGDYLLGWQGRSDVARYCHSFGEHEVDALASEVSCEAREVARFSADGRSGDLNRYLVLQIG